MAKKPKYYVVWKGRKTGIFTSWDECSAQVTGYPEAEYKSFESKEVDLCGSVVNSQFPMLDAWISDSCVGTRSTHRNRYPSQALLSGILALFSRKQIAHTLAEDHHHLQDTRNLQHLNHSGFGGCGNREIQGSTLFPRATAKTQPTLRLELSLNRCHCQTQQPRSAHLYQNLHT